MSFIINHRVGSEDMKNIILEKLTELQAQHGIKVLYACESGSRAWGFPSPDSDYDVRFIYKHDLNWYLTLVENQDTINLPIDAVLDIGGWDIRKSLRLLWKSNMALLEWVQSPMVYRAAPAFIESLSPVTESCFSPIAAMHHYLSMSKKYYAACVVSEKVKLKQYFYALRATLAGQWIAQQQCMPPIAFADLLPLVNDNQLQAVIDELLVLKAGQNENYLHPRQRIINEWLAATIADNERVAPRLARSNASIDDLNILLRRVLKDC